MTMKKIIILAAAFLMGASAFAQVYDDYVFTTVKENPITSVKNQYRSGTCWCFSGIGFIESEILRETGKEVDLSEMWVVGHSYHDRAVKYVRLDGKMGFSAGSSFGDVFQTIKTYGIVSQEAFSGMNYGTELPVQAELDAVLKGYVDAIVRVPNKELTPVWKDGFDGILKAYLGEYPETFSVDGVSYTPESYRDALGIDVDNYINLQSFSHVPFYEPSIIEVCDNWRWGTAYNLPIDEFMDAIDNAIMNGYTVAWGADVSEAGFTRNGLATCPVVEKKLTAGSDQEHWVGKEEVKEEKLANLPDEMEITQEMRQDAYDRKTTTDDHGMLIYGIAKDQNGNKFYMVKNSWGITGKYDGIWYASESFVKYKTLNVIINKDGLSKDVKKKLSIK